MAVGRVIACPVVLAERMAVIKARRKRTRAHGGCLWLSEAKKDVTSCEKPR